MSPSHFETSETREKYGGKHNEKDLFKRYQERQRERKEQETSRQTKQERKTERDDERVGVVEARCEDVKIL